MAVIVKYVVVRDGKEDMIFTTKKEADAYDKMLDIAEQLNAYLQTAEVEIAEDKLDELAFFMAQHRELIGKLLRGGSLDVPIRGEASAASAFGQEEGEGATAAADSRTTDTPRRARASKPKAVA
jgi:dsDNA-binding SOS-regulon protein